MRQAHEYGLVALSQGAGYWVERAGREVHLLVEPDHADRVVRHLDLYRREQRAWPFHKLVFADHPVSPIAWALWPALLIGFFLVSAQWSWQGVGRLSAEEVMGEGAWWLGFTALTLHADSAHLLANTVMGGGLFYLLARALGLGVASACAVLGGGFGNLLNAWFHFPGPHFSVGASTAVFAVVGLLASIPLGNKLRQGKPTEKSAWLVPLFAGGILLSWFGAGGDGRTDVTAHLFGFVAGLPIGLLAGAFTRNNPIHRNWQRFGSAFAALLMTLAWALAHHHS